MRKIYMDYAATTPVDPRVLREMMPYFSKKFGNTMSLHSWGQESRKILEESRLTLADLMKARSGRVIFTGSATEANNQAIKGIALARRNRGKHIIVSSIEHHCVLNSVHWLQEQSFDVTYLPVDKCGMVSPADLDEAMRKDTILVSIMHANNEIGTIEPIQEIGKICGERDVLFHTDAVQTYGKIPIDVERMNVGLLTASAHKMYGPKGVGALYISEGVKIEPLLHGGGHEFGLRSSTVNIPGIVGFAAAVEIAKREMNAEAERLTRLRDRLIRGISDIKEAHLNGHSKLRLPNNVNFWFAFIEGESLVAQLDMRGLAASTGSACSSESLEPSHVLVAIGLKHEQAHGSLRLSLGRWSTMEEVQFALKVLPEAVGKLRSISPFKEGW